MRYILRKWGGITSVVFLLAGCASSAHIEKDDEANFSNYKTFAWVDKDGEGKNDTNRHNDLAEQKIRTAVIKELEKTAGWKEAKHNPDILLSYDVLVEKGVKETQNPVYSEPFFQYIYNPRTRRYVRIYYPSRFVGYDHQSRPSNEGTITITMIDAKTDKVVWQGWTMDEVNNKNLTSKEIQYAVRAIFKKFDIAKN